MSKDKNKMEQAAAALIKKHKRSWSPDFGDEKKTILLNREGCPNEHSKVVQWLLRRKLATRQRYFAPGIMCRTRQFTLLRLKPAALKLAEAL